MLIMVLIMLQFAYIVARMYAFVEYIPILLGGEIFVVAAMMTIIINAKDNPSVKLSWCFLVGIFPIFGSVIYFVIKNDLGYRLLQRRVSYTEEEAKKYLPQQKEVLQELKEKDIQTYRIAKYLQKNSGSLVTKNNQVEYFPLGEDVFAAMLQELEKAKEYIFLEYFLISHGKMWNTILKILEHKAKEGVDVRILYDGTCSVNLLPYKYPEHIMELGIQCRMFSPPVPFVSTHYNNRDHRKIMVIDGRAAFTGGVNLCDEYINIDSPYGHWKDIGIMIKGDAVFDFTKMFLQMWTATEAKKIEKIEFPSLEKYMEKTIFYFHNACDKEAKQDNTGYVIPYADSPVDHENVSESVYIDILNQAKEYVYIMTPYLILDGEMKNAITFAAKRGVDVRIILPHIPDKWFAFVLAQSNYKMLLEAGVKVYEYTPGFVHAKLFIADNERATVGTANLDYRSLYWHYECCAYLYQVPVIREIYDDFIQTQNKCQQVTMNSIKKISLFSKVAAYVLKIVAPLM